MLGFRCLTVAAALATAVTGRAAAGFTYNHVIIDCVTMLATLARMNSRSHISAVAFVVVLIVDLVATTRRAALSRRLAKIRRHADVPRRHQPVDLSRARPDHTTTVVIRWQRSLGRPSSWLRDVLLQTDARSFLSGLLAGLDVMVVNCA